MNKKFVIFFFIFFHCSQKIHLLPITANELMKEVVKQKGKKAVLVNIWALWCVPCVEEFPMIVDFDQEIPDLEVIFVSADFEDQLSEVESFLTRQGLRQISYIKQEKDESFISGIHSKWTGSLPFTILYAKESGKIVDLWEGKEPESRFRTAINIALKS